MHINTINNINDSHKQLFIIQVYAGNCMNNIVLKHLANVVAILCCLAWSQLCKVHYNNVHAFH